jgi:hypothetical protein
MDKVYIKNSWYKDREPFILSLDARVNKEKIEGLQRVDIALLKSLAEKQSEVGIIPRYSVPFLKDSTGNLSIDSIEVEVYEMDSSSDAHMRVSEKICIHDREARKVYLALGLPYVHSLWVHSDKPLYAIVTAKLFVAHDNHFQMPFELSTICEGAGVTDIRKGE